MNWLGRIFTWWDGPTIGTQLFTWRKGTEVGRDGEGNIYYRSADGRRRWVIYNGPAEASRVPADWHLWLHGRDVPPPSERPIPTRSWEKPHVPNLTGSDEAYVPSGALTRGGLRARATGDYEAWVPE